MQKILILETNLDGHRLEFLHHLYTKATEDSNLFFYFAIPDWFEDVDKNLVWGSASNIIICKLQKNLIDSIENTNYIKSGINRLRLVYQLCRKYNIDRIVFISLMHYLPFLFFFNYKKVKISGIIYSLFIYEKEKIGKAKYQIKSLMFKLISTRGNLNKMFVLNDKKGAEILNKKYATNKFLYLPDPVPNIDMQSIRNIRYNYGIDDSKLVFLHFGALTERKGTIDILQAISLLEREDLENKVFIFAGKVYNDIKEKFYNLIKKLDNKAKIIVFDEFVEYQKLYNLCYSCDFILLPYLSTNASSGVIGYAAFFNKQVIGPKSGIIGGLISKYNLGVSIQNITKENIAKAINQIEKKEIVTTYVDDHSSIVFSDILLS